MQALQDTDARIGPVRQAIGQYVACIFEPNDIVEVRPIHHVKGHETSRKQSWHRGDELIDVVGELIEANDAGNGIYIGANPRTRLGGSKAVDVAFARTLFTDLDNGIGDDEARRRIEAVGLPPATLTIASGHGVHSYWRLREPIHDLGSWTNYQKNLIVLLHSDGSVHDAPRVMRLPGFRNHKPPPADCYVVEADAGRVYDLPELAKHIPQRTGTAEVSRGTQKLPKSAANGNGSHKSDLDTIGRAMLYAAKWEPVAENNGRNAAGKLHASQLAVDFELSDVDAWPILDRWNQTNIPPMDNRELRECLKNGRKYGKHALGEKLNQPNPTQRSRQRNKGGEDEGLRRLAVTCASDVNVEPIVWLWEPRFPLGELSEIVGHPDVGKSLLMIYMAAKITRGEAWADRSDAINPAGSVLILADEDSVSKVTVPRLIAAGANLKRIGIVDGVRRRPEERPDVFDLQWDIAVLEAEIVRRGDVRLVLIDPMLSYFGSGRDVHKDQEVRAVLMPLVAMAQRHNVAVVGLVHTNKTVTSTAALDRIMGSRALAAIPRAVWLVDRDPEDVALRVMVKVKGNLAADPGGLRFQIVSEPGGAPYLRWHEGAVELTADAVLAPRARERYRPRDNAKEWLAKTLANGPVRGALVKANANLKAFSAETLRRAREELCVLTPYLKIHGYGKKQCCWALPDWKEADAGPGPSEIAET